MAFTCKWEGLGGGLTLRLSLRPIYVFGSGSPFCDDPSASRSHRAHRLASAKRVSASYAPTTEIYCKPAARRSLSRNHPDRTAEIRQDPQPLMSGISFQKLCKEALAKMSAPAIATPGSVQRKPQQDLGKPNTTTDLPQASTEDIARLAYLLWEERGRPIGSAEVDWIEAERQLRSRS